ncbi:hypothetical protein [Cognatishimia sp.]|uniref:hypothetical protein n=1 Tax=Cognatishimia sp. TaxID=2211648 RepID=UPI0035185D71
MTVNTLLRVPEFDLAPEEALTDPGFHSEFPQVNLPFQITIGGLTMDGISISLTKALASGRLPADLEYQDELVSLRFDFDGFSITLYADAILSQDANDAQAPVSVFFTHPTDGHLSPLRYLINSFVAGDTVTMGHLLSSGAAPEQVRPQASTPAAKPARKPLRILLLALLGFGFGFAATDMIYHRVLLSHEPRPLTITQDSQALRATASGQIALINPQAAQGDVAYSLLANRGDLVSVRMPCDCAADPAQGAFQGATVLSGDPILLLTSDTVSATAQLRLSQRGLSRYLAGDQAEVVLADGRIVPVDLRIETPDAQTTATVIWPQDTQAPDPDSIALLRFNKLNGRFVRTLSARLTEVRARLLNKF